MTRPTHQAEGFCALLDEAGFLPVRCPTVEITAASDQSLARQQLQPLAKADIAIFTSANAVRYADSLTALRDIIAPQTLVFAIGPATATALEQIGVPAKLPLDDFSSQGLLALPELQQLKGKSVLLIRGLGGLQKLPESLLSMGANLYLAEVYQRQIPSNGSFLKRLFHSELPQIISTTSNESLSNLVTLLCVEERPHLWHIPLIVNSKRGEQLARSLGFCDDVLCASPVGDHGQISTLKAWTTQRLTQR